ncbi:MAG TPA: PilZ domain-containing protein [Anaeromyxobacter sp.]|nr:PilZ domain-containing protein [Anaeromyxobacter sp.]
MGERSDPGAERAVGLEQASDRRDSGRVAVRLLVRDAALGGSFEERPGNLSLGGVWFDGLHPPVGSRFELRFLLPGEREEIRAIGEVLRVSREGDRFGAHLRFLEIPLEAELAIARHLQER